MPVNLSNMPNAVRWAVFIVVCLSMAGCSKAQLVRFAPPGIIKYEDIAGEKPPNPAIEAVLAERRENSKAAFPKLSQTPGRDDRPRKPGKGEVSGSLSELAAKRDALNQAIIDDTSAAERDQNLSDVLIKKQQELAGEIESDTRAAARERRQPVGVEQNKK